MQRLRAQAEADSRRGAPIWYYDERPDCKRRGRELKKELARLHSLERNIVNAREGARVYCGGMKEMGKGVVDDDREDWDRQKVDEINTRGRSGYNVRKAGQGKEVFQQEVDTVGRLTPGGGFG